MCVVTGTGTEIGKTIVTAAIAALARAANRSVAVVKAAQTGIAGDEESDVEVVARLSGVADVHELARYPEPLAPATAARRAGMTPLSISDAADQIRALADRDLVLVEGAGGLLVRFDADDHTIADLAVLLDADVVVVTAPGLGTLNSTALTCDAIRDRGLRLAGVVVGSFPAEPDLASSTNLEDLPAYASAPLLGVMPAAIGHATPEEFLEIARRSLAGPLGGSRA
jgi:dethiobiotin synthetase